MWFIYQNLQQYLTKQAIVSHLIYRVGGQRHIQAKQNKLTSNLIQSVSSVKGAISKFVNELPQGSS